MPAKLTQESVIEKFKNAHVARYDYSLVKYKSQYDDVIIICREHGQFPQRPKNHWHGANCPKCGIEARREHFSVGTKEFIKKAQEKFGNKFDYDKVNYINQYEKVEIGCSEHGLFLTVPKDHLNSKYGCPICADIAQANVMRKENETFIEELKLIHGDKYDYSLVEYVGCKYDIFIICSKHGKFKQNAAAHLNGCECPKCKKFISKPEMEWLDYIGIKEENRNIRLPNISRKFRVDGYDPENKIAYEFNGDYFHGNPLLFKSNEINVMSKKTFGNLYDKTIERQKHIINAGYKLICIWENKYNTYKKDISSGKCKPEDILNYCEVYEARSE